MKTSLNTIEIICILLFILTLVLLYLYHIKCKKIENFDGQSQYSKEELVDNCKNNYAITSLVPEGERESFCYSNTYVTIPSFLYSMCGIANEQSDSMFVVKENGQRFYGCKQGKYNSYGLNWNNNSARPYSKFVSPYAVRNQIEVFNDPIALRNVVRPLIVYFASDEKATVTYKGKSIEKKSRDVFSAEFSDVAYGDDLTVKFTSPKGERGGLAISYIWNGNYYVLENNNFDKELYLMDYSLSSDKGFSGRWTKKDTPLGMTNWRLTDKPKVSAVNLVKKPKSKSNTMTIKVGQSENWSDLTNKLTVFIASDDDSDVYVDGDLVFEKKGWDKFMSFSVENVSYGQDVVIKTKNLGGPGGLSFCYVWNGFLYVLPSLTKDKIGIGEYTQVMKCEFSPKLDPIKFNDETWKDVPVFPFMKQWIDFGEKDSLDCSFKVGDSL